MKETKWIYANNENNTSRYLLGIEGERPIFCFGINPSTAEPNAIDKIAEEKRRNVKLIITPVRGEKGYIGVKVDATFRNQVKNESGNKQFRLNRTMKVPYLYDNENKEIDKAIELIKQKLYG